MTGRRVAAAAIAAGALAMATPMGALALAAEPGPGPVGRWEGSVVIGDREVPVAVDLAPGAAGRWGGSIVLSGLGVKGAPLSDVTVAAPRVAFALAQGERGVDARFELRVDGPDRLTGTVTHAGRSSPVGLRRTGEAQVDRPLASTAIVNTAIGEWQGEYELFGYPRKVTLRLSNELAPDGRHDVGRASFVIVGKRKNDLPVDLVRQEGDTLFVASSATGIRFEGRLPKAGDVLAGSVLQGPLEIPLTLTRVTGGSAR